MHGKGLYLFCSGKEKIYKIYTGDWYNGKMHGKGLMKYTDGYYEGDWVNDKREGKGKFLWTKDPNKGDIYEGEYKNDKRNGHGVVKYHNGDI